LSLNKQQQQKLLKGCDTHTHTPTAEIWYSWLNETYITVMYQFHKHQHTFFNVKQYLVPRTQKLSVTKVTITRA
jgi:hypothetical protein